MPSRILRGFSTLLRVTPQMFLCSASVVLLVFAASSLASPFYDLLNPRINWIGLLIAIIALSASFAGAIQLVLEKDDDDVACTARIHYLVLIVIVSWQLIIATLAQDYVWTVESVLDSGGTANTVGEQNILDEVRRGFYSTWDRFSCGGGECLDTSCQRIGAITCDNARVTSEFNRWVSSGVAWTPSCLSGNNIGVENAWCFGKMRCLEWCVYKWQTNSTALWVAFGVFVVSTASIFWTIHPRKWHRLTNGVFNRKDSSYYYYTREASNGCWEQ